jgi:tetratricopeptide (TPR) repeat protein
MTLAFLAGLAAAASVPAPPSDFPGGDAEAAIEAGRLDQARFMIARAATDGVKGPIVDKLLADLAFAEEKFPEAFARYRQLAGQPPKIPAMCERAAIAALRFQAIRDAASMIDCATSGPSRSWRAWNARGVLADVLGEWGNADAAYGKATEVGGSQPDIVNNQAWSYLLRGDWARARDGFQRAVQLDPKSPRIANNLELASAALAAQLPERKAAESDSAWAARLNDAGIAAQLLGDRKRAVAAFTQALEASGHWYSRAGNNLQAVTNQ